MFTGLSCSRNLKLHRVVVAVVNGGFVTQTSTCKVIGGGERTTCLFAHKHQLDVQASVMCAWCVGVCVGVCVCVCVRMCGVCVCVPLYAH